jgi:hypothetical protein
LRSPQYKSVSDILAARIKEIAGRHELLRSSVAATRTVTASKTKSAASFLRNCVIYLDKLDGEIAEEFSHTSRARRWQPEECLLLGC